MTTISNASIEFLPRGRLRERTSRENTNIYMRIKSIVRRDWLCAIRLKNCITLAATIDTHAVRCH